MDYSPTFCGAAAHRLVSARKSKGPRVRLAECRRPTSLEEALEIQRRVRLLLNDSVGGWKGSVPGPNVVAAPIYDSTIYTDFLCPVLACGGVARVEPEIAFVLAHDLPPREREYSEAEMAAAIGETRLVLELVGSRYAEPARASFPELLADNLSNQGLFVGPVVHGGPDVIPGQLAITVRGPDGILVERQGSHPDGHPIRSFRWLVQFLAKRGEAMTEGQLLITGSFAGVLEIPLNKALRFSFGELGVLAVQFCSTDVQGAD